MDDYPERGRGDGPGWGDGGWGFMHGGMSWVGWLFMVLFLLFLVALVIGVVLLLVRSTSAGGGPGSGAGASTGGPSSAERTLDERYARGDIEEEEYLRRRSILRGGG